MPKITVEINPEYEPNRVICERYWEQDSSGQFKIKAQDLAVEYGIPRSELIAIVRKNSRVWCEELTCRRCEKPLYYAVSRMALANKLKELKHMSSTNQICSSCAFENKVKEYLRLSRNMQEAYLNGYYEILTKVEYRFWAALSKTKNIEKAGRIIGISSKTARRIYHKLEELYLVTTIEGEISIHNQAAKLLEQHEVIPAIRPIFTSPIIKKLYQKLKFEYMYVYPEIAICSVVDEGAVEHLFTKRWQKYYFLSCRVDFMVCNQEAYPILAVEYNGGYHQETIQKSKDDFKKLLLNEVGIPLQVFTKDDIQDWYY